MTTKSISITGSRDVGCEIAEAEFDLYRELVAAEVARVYECECTYEEAALGSTNARADGFAASEEADVCEGARSIAQDVWEAGEFWSSADSAAAL